MNRVSAISQEYNEFIHFHAHRMGECSTKHRSTGVCVCVCAHIAMYIRYLAFEMNELSALGARAFHMNDI